MGPHLLLVTHRGPHLCAAGGPADGRQRGGARSGGQKFLGGPRVMARDGNKNRLVARDSLDEDP